MKYGDYLRSAHWKKKKQQALDYYGNSCMLCSKEGDLHVHHRTYKNIGNESISDLVVLCPGCHGLFHEKIRPPRSLQWEEIGLVEHMYRHGYNTENISRITGLPNRTIEEIARATGAEEDLIASEIRQLDSEGFDVADISAAVQRSIFYVQRRLSEGNLKTGTGEGGE